MRNTTVAFDPHSTLDVLSSSCSNMHTDALTCMQMSSPMCFRNQCAVGFIHVFIRRLPCIICGKCWVKQSNMFFKCRMLRASNTFVGYEYLRGGCGLQGSSSHPDLEPFLSQSISWGWGCPEQLRKMLTQELYSHLVSSPLTRAKSLLWPKSLLCDVDNHCQEQSLVSHIHSTLLLITDTIFVELKTEKYALVTKAVFAKLMDL